MQRVFLFWVIILIVLAVGIATIIYSEKLLKEEQAKAEQLRKELAASRGPRLPVVPVAPELPEKPISATVLEIDLEELPAKIEIPEPVPPLDVESLKAPESSELPETPEGETGPLPPLPPQAPNIPTLPEIPKHINVESLKAPELPAAQGAPIPPTPAPVGQ